MAELAGHDAGRPARESEERARRERELDEARMSFLEHLRDLRVRLRNAILALCAGFFLALAFKEEVLLFLMRPLLEVWRNHRVANPSIGEPTLHFGSLIEPFWAYFSLSLWAALFVSSPFVFHQLWKFVAPGLYRREKRIGIAFAVVSAFFFTGGALFCYQFVLPVVYEFLLSYSAADLARINKGFGLEYDMGQEVALRPTLFIREYIAFSRKLLLGFGLVFELPLFVFFLSLTGAVTHRGMWKFNRWWIVLSFVISAALTPPDVMSQILMAGPLVILYNLSIGIAYVITKRRERREAALMVDP